MLYEVGISSNLETGSSQTPLIKITQTETIQKVYVDVKTAPTGQSIVIDINKNGATIWTNQGNRASIAAGATSGSTTTFDVTNLVEGDILTFDIDQIGSGTPGADLTIAVKTQ